MFRFFRKKRNHADLFMEFGESQRVLLEAAVSTSLAAKEVTNRLKAGLTDAHRQFEGTAKILDDALFLCSLDGTIHSFNPAAVKIFGIGDFTDLNIRELLVGVDESDLWEKITDAHAPRALKGKTVSGQKWIEPSATRLDWSDGESSMLVLIRDIDSDVEHAHHHQAMFESAFDGIIIEQNDLITAANPSAVKLFGYTIDEMLGRPVSILFSEADHDKIEYPIEYSEIGCEGVTTNGNILKMDVSITKISWRGHEAHLLTLKDLTEFKRFQRISSRDNGVDFVCCFDRDFRLTFVNTLFARFCKSTRHALIGCDIRDLIRKSDLDRFLANIGKLSPRERSSRIQTEYDGKLVDWIDHAVFDKDGLPTEYHRIGRDITEIVNR